ncbi:MAG: hypothetical protein FWG78_01000 [Coriobacteriia bacterium]|nr:hypothetical protein [Coriobacteriia bacterium]
MSDTDLPQELAQRRSIFRSTWMLFLIGLGIVAVLYGSVTIHYTSLFAGANYGYYLSRIDGIAAGIFDAQFPVRIYPNMNAGFGYGAGFFSPDFMLYPSAMLRVIGWRLSNFANPITVPFAYNMTIFVSMLMLFSTTFFAAFRLTRRAVAGAIAGVAVCVMPWTMHAIFERAALNEVLAMIWIPLVIVGVYDILTNKMRRPWPYVIGLWALMFSHLPTAIVTLLTVAIVLVVRAKTLRATPHLTRRVLLFTLLATTLSAAFWVPMLEMLFSARFTFETTPLLWLGFALPLLTIASVLAALALGWLVTRTLAFLVAPVALILGIITFQVIFAFINPTFISHERWEPTYTPPRYESLARDDAWNPLGTQFEQLRQMPGNEVQVSDGRTIHAIREGTTVQFEHRPMDTEITFTVPLVYYKGYGVRVDEYDGRYTNLTAHASANQNLVEVTVPAGLGGSFNVRYDGTVLQRIGFYLTVISFIFSVFLFFYLRNEH